MSTELSRCIEFWEDIDALEVNELHILYETIRDKLRVCNSYVGLYNPILLFCTGSHNNCVMLGGDQQAKGAVFYVFLYMTKEKTTLLHTISLMQSALCHVDHYKSIASDKGEASCDAKQLLHRIMNQMNLNMELSDYQIAAALLGVPSILQTDSFVYCNPEVYMGYRMHIQMHADHDKR